MKRNFLFLSLVVCLFAVPSDGATDSGIWAGLAVADITPPIGGKTTGYASAQPSDGIHDPLTARVLLLKSETTTVAIVVWDLCIFNSVWLHEQMADMGVDHLLLMNTHTHSGPNLNQDDFPSGEEPWRQTVERRVLDSIRQAKENVFRAHIAAGMGSIQLGYNRLVRQPEGHSITHFENPERIPYGPVDPTVGVLRIADDVGAVRAVIVNYACHPVVLGPKNRKISADYPGVMRKIVEEKFGSDCVCIFAQGGAGDINPLILARSGEPERDFPLVESMGKLLADEVLETLGRMRSEKGESASLRIASRLIDLESRWTSGEPLKLGVTSLLINSSIGIVTMPGEPFHQFQVDLRRKAALPFTFFFGYCNDTAAPWPSYLPDLESAARGGYGASDTTRAEVGAGERLLNIGLAQLFTLRERLKPEAQRHVNE
ncbi:MAG: neutral/alkaline non-lysosomal ceramidase N-terminal domain-containing protein [Verrucomicrobia bacterium]|nr:neutral/alkaline non-lysosomal ceramidase N-terminal domain-containing protein [Verrucomicrobiota bacterium]